MDAERGRHCRRNEHRVSKWREVDEACAIGIRIARVTGKLECETSFTYATRADKRQDAIPERHLATQFCKFVLTTDERV